MHPEIPSKILVPKRTGDFPRDSQTSEEAVEHWFSFLKKMNWRITKKSLSAFQAVSPHTGRRTTSDLRALAPPCSARAVHTTGGWGRTCSKYLLSLRYQAYTTNTYIFCFKKINIRAFIVKPEPNLVPKICKTYSSFSQGQDSITLGES